jgi:hypothetical protein
MPIVGLLLATCVGAISVALACLAVVRRLMRRRIGDGHNDVLSAIFQTGGTIYAVFLAFLVVAIWESHEAAHANVADEASLLSTLYRASTAMEPQSGARLRGLIREYTHAVIDDEWKIQARSGGASERARAAGLGMFRLFGELTPAARQNDGAIDQAALAIVSQLQSDRNRRTLQAGETISPVIWWAALVNGVLVVVMSFFFYTDQGWPQVVMCGVLTAMISMLLCVVFILERPFGGLLPLRPDPFVHSLEVYDSVDRAVANG